MFLPLDNTPYFSYAIFEIVDQVSQFIGLMSGAGLIWLAAQQHTTLCAGTFEQMFCTTHSAIKLNVVSHTHTRIFCNKYTRIRSFSRIKFSSLCRWQIPVSSAHVNIIHIFGMSNDTESIPIRTHTDSIRPLNLPTHTHTRALRLNLF